MNEQTEKDICAWVREYNRKAEHHDRITAVYSTYETGINSKKNHAEILIMVTERIWPPKLEERIKLGVVGYATEINPCGYSKIERAEISKLIFDCLKD